MAEDRAIGRSAAAAERPASTVEERELDAAGASRYDQLRLGLVEHPGRGEEPGLLVRVRVAEHHFLAIAPVGQPGTVIRIVEQRAEDGAG